MTARYRHDLPQLASSRAFLTDGGMETDLIFHEGFDLPLFASFPLVDDARGREALRRYYRRFALVAKEAKAGFVLEAGTWRASREWATQLGYGTESLADANRRAVEMLTELREELGESEGPLVISSAIGPRGDAYRPDALMTPAESQEYHAEQIETLSNTDTDLVTALTITYAAEAVGIVRAARVVDLPAVISFTIETDGNLPDGSALADAILEVDEITDGGPAYYGVNCAHPTHVERALEARAKGIERIRMVRANASRLSHAELDEAPDLDEGDPEEFGAENVRLREHFPHINVLGGCCGTDVRHVQAIARSGP
jgi:homocysteine S-methyltransferase